MRLRNLVIFTLILISTIGCINTYESALAQHEEQSALGDDKATYKLALHYLGKYPIGENYLIGHNEIDYKKSANYLKLLSEKDHAEATYILASLYANHYYVNDDNYLSTRSRCDAVDIINQTTSTPFKKCFWTPSDDLKIIVNNEYHALINKAAGLGHTKALIQKSKDNPDCSITIPSLKVAAFENGSLEAATRLGIIYQSLYSGEFYDLKLALKMFNIVEEHINQATMEGIQLQSIVNTYKSTITRTMKNSRSVKSNNDLVEIARSRNFHDCQAEFNRIPALNNLFGA